MLSYLATNIIPLFIIIMMSGMLTEEYVGGTLKLSLLHPVTRSRLLTAKICALAVPILIFLVFTLLAGYGLGTAFFGWGDRFIYQDLVYTTREGIIFTVSSYLISFLPTLAFSALVMLISLQFTSGGAAVGALIGLVITMSIAGQLFKVIQPFLIIYRLTFFQTLLMGGELNQTILSLYLFNKKDITF